MIWHIFKKDLRLMWPLAAAVVLVAVLESYLRIAATTIALGPFALLLTLLPVVIMLGIAFVTVIVVQQDNLVGDRDDWLLRPISAHSVLAAKLLFVALALHAPLFIIDILEVTRTGVPMQQSLVPAMSHQLVLFCLFTTPALMIGATTRSLVGALIFSVCIVILFFLMIMVAINTGIHPNASVSNTGYSWIVAWATGLTYVAVFVCLARFQFRRRRETVSRIVGVAVTVAAFVLLWCFPWGAALQAQQWIDGSPVTEVPIVLSFSTDLSSQVSATETTGRHGSPVDDGGVLAPFRPGRDFTILDLVSGIHRVVLPVQIGGLPPGAVLVADRVTFRVTKGNGTLIFAANSGVCAHPDRGGTGFACVDAELRGHQGLTDHGAAHGEFLLPLPTVVYEAIKDQPVQIAAEFTLTLLQQNGPQLMHAVNDKRLIEGIGGCTTGIDRDADEIEFRCMTAVRQPSCIAVSLQDPHTGSGNPVLFGCALDYAPFPANWMPPALVKRGGADLPFLDPDGLAHYPVGTSQISDAQVVITTYMPMVHFSRQLAIPAVRLIDWDDRQKKPVVQ